MMQDHPIELLCNSLEKAAQVFGRGVLGLMAGLGLIGLMWLSAMRPADAAFARVVTPVPFAGAAPAPRPVISVTTLAAPRGAAATPEAAGTGGVQDRFPVCALVIDLSAPDPLAAGCATGAALAN